MTKECPDCGKQMLTEVNANTGGALVWRPAGGVCNDVERQAKAYEMEHNKFMWYRRALVLACDNNHKKVAKYLSKALNKGEIRGMDKIMSEGEIR